MNKAAVGAFTLLSLSIGLALLSASAQAQIYKCSTGGRTTFQAIPCDDDGRTRQQMLDEQGRTRAPTSRMPMPWDELKLNMSVDEVKRLMPGAAEASGILSQPNGAQGLLKHEKVRFGHRDYEATYFFLDGAFDRVTYALPGIWRPLPQALEGYAEVYQQLVARYGQPSDSSESRESDESAEKRAVWNLPNGDRVVVGVAGVTRDVEASMGGALPQGAVVLAVGYTPSAEGRDD